MSEPIEALVAWLRSYAAKEPEVTPQGYIRHVNRVELTQAQMRTLLAAVDRGDAVAQEVAGFIESQRWCLVCDAYTPDDRHGEPDHDRNCAYAAWRAARAGAGDGDGGRT